MRTIDRKMVAGSILAALVLAVPIFAQNGGAAGAAQQKQRNTNPVHEDGPPPPAPNAGSAVNGKKLWDSVGCWQCHGYAGQGGVGARLAPNPPALATIVNYVRNPKGEMPPYTSKVISDAELGDIYAYLKSIPKAPDPKSIPLLNK